MNKLQILQEKIKALPYSTYPWGTFYVWQDRNKLLDRLEAENIPPTWLEAKRLPPSQIKKLRCFCKKHYPGVEW